ncbi:helix-turn-helix transcriptional regulator [Flammeovirga aprica]|uniref:Uncharacterized protein n=1 Tax=Flammeovirga aprica JL-4 TaxID=694437 RepID=A0A7X9XC95_9BACT|nr:helix-turn-helix transcriptional regulator [Flammeovirga aprica]NME71515.1 hypothetical protein [Flammeovirga aprica JL-4]
MKAFINYSDGMYWVSSSENEGIGFTCGETIEEAISNFNDIVEIYNEEGANVKTDDIQYVLKELFEELGISTAYIASQLGKTRPWLSKRINGIVNFTEEERSEVEGAIRKIGENASKFSLA